MILNCIDNLIRKVFSFYILTIPIRISEQNRFDKIKIIIKRCISVVVVVESPTKRRVLQIHNKSYYNRKTYNDTA